MEKITVLIRTFNSEKTVRDTVESVLRQTMSSKDYNILLIDDGSTDGTMNILKSFQLKIKIIQNSHIGPIKALNVGLKKIKTDFYTIVDSDDTVEPKMLLKLYMALVTNPDAGYSYCDYYEHSLQSNKTVVTTDNIFNTLAAGILFRTDLVRDLDGYDEHLFFPEYDLLIKLLKNHKGIHVKSPLYHYRRRDDSLVANTKQVKNGLRQLFDKYGQRFPIRSYTLR